MKIWKILILICLFSSGCVHNSISVLDVTGTNMNFSYAFLAIKGVKRVLLLRETNSGEGNAINNLKDIEAYLCPKTAKEAEVPVLGEIVESSPILAPNTGIPEPVAEPINPTL